MKRYILPAVPHKSAIHLTLADFTMPYGASHRSSGRCVGEGSLGISGGNRGVTGVSDEIWGQPGDSGGTPGDTWGTGGLFPGGRGHPIRAR